MSILSAINTGLGVLTSLASTRAALSTPALPASVGMMGRSFENLVPYQPSLPSLPGVGTGGRIVGGGFSTGTGLPMQGPPSGYHWAKDGSGRIVRNRRMNPLNASAARRAIRRIKGARKMLRSIESSLPKRAAPRVTRKR